MWVPVHPGCTPSRPPPPAGVCMVMWLRRAVAVQHAEHQSVQASGRQLSAPFSCTTQYPGSPVVGRWSPRSDLKAVRAPASACRVRVSCLLAWHTCQPSSTAPTWQTSRMPGPHPLSAPPQTHTPSHALPPPTPDCVHRQRRNQLAGSPNTTHPALGAGVQ